MSMIMPIVGPHSALSHARPPSGAHATTITAPLLKAQPRPRPGFRLQYFDGKNWRAMTGTSAWKKGAQVRVRVQNLKMPGSVSQTAVVRWGSGKAVVAGNWTFTPASDGVLVAQYGHHTMPSAELVLQQVKKVNSYWIEHNSGPGQWPKGATGWARSVYHIGNLEAYRITKDKSFLTHTREQTKAFNWQVNGGAYSGNADARAIGQVYLGLSQSQTELASTKRQADESIDKNLTKRWTWIDAMFMEAASLAELGNRYPNDLHDYHGHLHELFLHMRDVLKLFDRSLGLWYRDRRFTPGGAEAQSPNAAPVAWSRGNGWVFAALARVIEALPKSAPGYQTYVSTFRAMADSLLSRQRGDGFWNSNLADPKHAGGPETTGTSAFVYGMAIGVRLKLLDQKKFSTAIAKGWHGLTHVAIQKDGLLGYCQPGGDRPRAARARMTTDFGVGLFLLAASAVRKLA